MSAVSNHPATQNLKDTVANGEVRQAAISTFSPVLTSFRDTVPKSPRNRRSPQLWAQISKLRTFVAPRGNRIFTALSLDTFGFIRELN